MSSTCCVRQNYFPEPAEKDLPEEGFFWQNAVSEQSIAQNEKCDNSMYMYNDAFVPKGPQRSHCNNDSPIKGCDQEVHDGNAGEKPDCPLS